MTEHLPITSKQLDFVGNFKKIVVVGNFENGFRLYFHAREKIYYYQSSNTTEARIFKNLNRLTAFLIEKMKVEELKIEIQFKTGK